MIANYIHYDHPHCCEDAVRIFQLRHLGGPACVAVGMGGCGAGVASCRGGALGFHVAMAPAPAPYAPWRPAACGSPASLALGLSVQSRAPQAPPAQSGRSCVANPPAGWQLHIAAGGLGGLDRSHTRGGLAQNTQLSPLSQASRAAAAA